jgi:hypothetical protein
MMRVGACVAIAMLAAATLVPPGAATAQPVAGDPAARDAVQPQTQGVAALVAERPDAAKLAPPALLPMSSDASQLVGWVLASGDNNSLPFAIVDKVQAGVWVFNANGLFMGSAPVLVGATQGDDAEPGVGDRELSNIPRAQRTTPAGRFVASFGRASGGRSVLWVDYTTAVSLHAVITRNKKERRLERLNSPTPDDNRITYGCINVPTAFYKKVIRTIFAAHGIVYILPETKSFAEVFPAYRPQQPQSAFSATSR